MSFIKLTKAQADAVRGETTPGHVIDPIEQEDGSFIVNDGVLADSAHAAKFDVLKDLPRIEKAEIRSKVVAHDE